MFGSGKKSGVVPKIDSLISASARIEGAVVFAGGLRIDGEVNGSVSAAEGASSSMLVLSEHARVVGPIAVAHLITNGVVVGAVTAAEMLEMQPNSKIIGDVSYASIEMHQGAIVEGRLSHLGDKPVELKLAVSA